VPAASIDPRAPDDAPDDAHGDTHETGAEAAVDTETTGGDEALVALRRHRRRKALAHFDWVEALYKTYLAGIAGIVVVLVLSAAARDDRLGPAAAADVRTEGPAWVGVVLALAVAAGLRSGARGGPLALEAAEVRHVLLAPVDRRRALCAPALRFLRFSLFLGVVGGAIAGQVAFRRLPGNEAAWVAVGVATGVLAVAGFGGAAMVASGRRLSRLVVDLLAVVVLAWSIVDALRVTTTSPMTLAGGTAVWPLSFQAIDLVGAIPFVALPLVGLAGIAGMSLEAAERRSGLVGQLRFAVTLQDVRTAVVLRRQLTLEGSRRRPFVRIGGPGRRRNTRFPTWQRGWQGVARWPLPRWGRMTILGIGAGFCLAGVWKGTSALVVPAGLLVWLAGLDAIEPMAQEIDHPSLLESYPEEPGVVRIRHLGVALAVMVPVGLAGCAAALVFGEPSLVAEVGLPTVAAAALGGVCGAAVSVVRGAPKRSALEQMSPEAAGSVKLIAAAIPPGLAILGVAPVLVARIIVERDGPPLAAALAGGAFVLAASLLVVVYLRMRERARTWWERQLEISMSGSSLRDAARKEAQARIDAKAGGRRETPQPEPAVPGEPGRTSDHEAEGP
jgi:hypothetical protein